MSSEEKLKELIPLYLNGALTKEEKKEFEDSLKGSVSLQQELSEFKEIKEFYSDIEEEIPQPPPEVFDRVLRNIEGEGQRQAEKQFNSSLQPVFEFFEGLFKGPAFSWGVAGVQFAIILFLVSGAPEEKKYETLSSGQVTMTDKVTLKVVFNESARESEIRKLVLSLDGQLVSGPSSVGSYTLAISSKGPDVEKILATLKNSPIVIFAGKSF
ncbi:MAG: hypothetical protein ACE5FU_03215 [Nitrospinota bacterium]